MNMVHQFGNQFKNQNGIQIKKKERKTEKKRKEENKRGKGGPICNNPEIHTPIQPRNPHTKNTNYKFFLKTPMR